MPEGAVAGDRYRWMTGRGVRDARPDDGARSKMQRPLRCTELADRRGGCCVFAIERNTLWIVGDGPCQRANGDRTVSERLAERCGQRLAACREDGVRPTGFAFGLEKA
ncbi:hypothetical protein [Accumulibacter sp.]|uniref:hypothetical protein n=1 Tax=Accumulibacter sp. TaxID=2053492 RepID=UPI0025D2B703|nr:hypothetical protein [Accumulibacter sp.]MCM8611097.1 hypothetical protein [Accumulibacter sp.]MCM8636211.1 hypothetical protein [Accumulibacter sp.]MCM8640610.1 hypothetical protein [Accumulibacter sp.]